MLDGWNTDIGAAPREISVWIWAVTKTMIPGAEPVMLNWYIDCWNTDHRGNGSTVDEQEILAWQLVPMAPEGLESAV